MRVDGLDGDIVAVGVWVGSVNAGDGEGGNGGEGGRWWWGGVLVGGAVTVIAVMGVMVGVGVVIVGRVV